MNIVKEESFATVIGKIVLDPTNFFRTLEVICIEPDKGIFGQAWHQEFQFDTSGPTQLPAAPVYPRKFIFTTNEKGGMNSFIVTNGRIDPTIPSTITASVNPRKLQLPKDGHIRWTTNAPDTDNSIGYLNHNGETMEIDPRSLDLDSICLDMQLIYMLTFNRYVLHARTQTGNVFTGYISPADIRSKKLPEMAKIEDGATALITIPRDNEIIPIIGTDYGIKINGGMFDFTKGQPITGMTIDSEKNLIVYRSNGKMFAFRFDYNLRPIGTPILVDDNIDEFPWTATGRALEQGTRQNIVLGGSKKSIDGKHNIFTRKVVSFQPNF